MKSTIKIALGAGNEPVLNFNIIPSDDLRDQLCCQWMHKLGGESTLASISITGNHDVSGNQVTHLLEISPITPSAGRRYGTSLEHLRIVEGMEYSIRNQTNDAWTSMCISGDTICWEDGKENTVSPKLSRYELEKLHFTDLYKKIEETLTDRSKWATNQLTSTI